MNKLVFSDLAHLHYAIPLVMFFFSERGGGAYLPHHQHPLLSGLVGDDVEHVVAPHDAVVHLRVASDVRVISFDASDGPAHLRGLDRGDPERI